MSKSTAKMAREESKKKTAVSKSWMLLDSTGEGTILDVDKYAIMQSVQIHGRDLRILDPLLSYPSTILGRDQAIVLNLEHFKAIITAEEMLLRDPMDDNVIPIVEQLRKHLPHVNTSPALGDTGTGEQRESPFEFRALEVALESICTYLDAQTTELETAAYPALDDLTSKISSRNLDRVLKLKSVMTGLTARVQKIRDELEQLLDDDDDMSDLYLSRKIVGSSSPISGSGAHNSISTSTAVGSKISRVGRASVATIRGNENDVEELEMLLEAYFIQIDGTLNKLTTVIYVRWAASRWHRLGTSIQLREFINDTEDYINIQLENRRNQLIQLSLFLSSGTVSLSVFSFVCGIFGVNIPYNWNDGHAYLFKWVLLVTGICSTFIFVMIIFHARRKGLVGS